MNYPLISEYVEAIKAAEENFDQLKHLCPVLGEDGEPVMTSGNFAVVFKMKDEQTGKLHAVKCFLKEQEGRAEAYRQIAEELEYVSSTFLTPIKYLDKELFVDSANSEDSEFPVLLMDWVEGQTLDKYIREHIDDQYELSLLAYQFSRLAMWLMPQPFAHGDLKPDNILVKEDGTLVLVDYDGMYVPAMKGQKARELGSPDFRHPGRTEEVFDDHIDDFSLASILLSLKAIALQPSLLEEYGASDRLLFSERDYRNLSKSSALGALQPLMQDAELASLYSLYILALSQNNLSQVSFRLFNLSRPEKLQYEEENLSTEVTEEDLANAWTDKSGAKYSADRKKMLVLPRETCDPSFRTGGTFYISFSVNEGTKIICDNAFRQCRSLESITIPNSVVKIGKSAFSECRRLNTISLSTSLIEIGDRAFEGCRDLTSISFPAHLMKIGKHLFSGCSSLSSMTVDKDNVYYDSRDNCDAIIETSSNTLMFGCTFSTISNSITTIGDYAFESCNRLPSIIIPNGVKCIGNFAFSRCDFTGGPLSRLEKLRLGIKYSTYNKKIYIPESVNEIGFGAFYGYYDFSIEVDKFNRFYDSRNNCNAIIDSSSNTLIAGCSTTRIPKGVTKIGSYAFCKCLDLKSIAIPESVKVIDDEAFKDCENLLSIVIPNSVVSMGKDAFYGCEWLQSVTLSSNLRKIEDSVFARCGRLKAISIPESVSAIGDYAFEDCYNLIKVELSKSIRTIGNSSFSGCSCLTSISIPNSVQNIGAYAFERCCISSIEIPENVTKIGPGAFGCYGLTSIVVDKRNKFFDSRNNCNAIIDSNTNVLITGCSTTEIPNNVLGIGCSAFHGCEHLVSITIPKNVKKIEEYAFDVCADFETIEFLGTVEYIGKYTFEEDGGVPSIIIPEGARMKYEELLPDYKAKIHERVFVDNHKGLKRPFCKEEIEYVNKAEVVHGQYTKQVCFYMNDGCQKYIPLCKQSDLSIGDKVDLNKAKLIEFDDEGIYYGLHVDGYDDVQKYLVEA